MQWFSAFATMTMLFARTWVRVPPSDVVPRLFFAKCIGDTRPSVRYLITEDKERFGEGSKPILGSKA